MAAPDFLRVVGGTDRERIVSPDADLRRLLKRRMRLHAELHRVDAQLFAHRRRKADERGQVPPRSIDELIIELGIARDAAAGGRSQRGQG